MGRKLEGRCQELFDLSFRIQIGSCALGPERQQAWWGNLGTWICGVPMPREYADETKTLGPIARLMIFGHHGPFHCQFRRDVWRCFLLQECCKIQETRRHLFQLESQAAAECHVVFNGFSQRLHRLPPGQGSAMERSDATSTLA